MSPQLCTAFKHSKHQLAKLFSLTTPCHEVECGQGFQKFFWGCRRLNLAYLDVCPGISLKQYCQSNALRSWVIFLCRQRGGHRTTPPAVCKQYEAFFIILLTKLYWCSLYSAMCSATKSLPTHVFQITSVLGCVNMVGLGKADLLARGTTSPGAHHVLAREQLPRTHHEQRCLC